jgi:hypothetical protein
MRRLSVNDRRHIVLRILADAFPDAHYVAACRVDDLRTDLPEPSDRSNIGTERGDDDNIILPSHPPRQVPGREAGYS